MSGIPQYHVFTRVGDASAEVEDMVREIGSADEAGLHRYFYVTRANQTVVMAVSDSAPIARALRQRGGWREPEGGPSPA